MLGSFKQLINNDNSRDNETKNTRPFNNLRTKAAQKLSNFTNSGATQRTESFRSDEVIDEDRSIQSSGSHVAGKDEPLARQRSNSLPTTSMEPTQLSLRIRALQARANAITDRVSLPRLPSFHFSLPFSDQTATPQTRDDAIENIRDMADNISMTSLETESQQTAIKAQNNRMRGLIDGLPKLSLSAGTSAAPYASLSQDTQDLNIIVLGGYRGSVLRSAEDNKMLWVPVKVGLGLRKVDLELPLTNDAEELAVNSIYPDGMLTNIGPVDISRRLLRRLREQEARGFCKVHEYGYDWRLGGRFLSDRLEKFMDSLTGPSLVIAHSLGGLITMHVLNRRPELFTGVLFAGTPFSGCPNILGPLRYGDSVLLNDRILNPRTNFSMRSSFLLLPTHKRCFVDITTNKEIPVDFFDSEQWVEYGLSPEVARDHGAGDVGQATEVNGMIASGGVGGPTYGKDTNDILPTTATEHRREEGQDLGSATIGTPNSPVRPVEYLQRTLQETLNFKSGLQFRSDVKYPPIALLRSKTTPTVRGCSVFGEQGIKNGDYSKFIFSAGDGVVTYASSDIRLTDVPGTIVGETVPDSPWEQYLVKIVDNDRGHIGLLGDLQGVEQCLSSIIHAGHTQSVHT